jgi:Ran GTPase-activating protein (RanGAP) involved in mRNA processing and transport
LVKKNTLANLDFQNITMKMMNAKPIFKIQIGSKMGLKGWNSIKNILKYGEFQFSIDFSARRSFDRIRLSDPGVKEFMYGIENSTSLRQLNIKENNITASGVEVIKNYLPKTKIKELNISHNPLGNDGIQLIAELLATYEYELLELDISSCEFNYVGAMNLYSCLHKNIPLRVLHINDNKLRGPTMKYFTEAMWKNTNLERLSMSK